MTRLTRAIAFSAKRWNHVLGGDSPPWAAVCLTDSNTSAEWRREKKRQQEQQQLGLKDKDEQKEEQLSM